MTTKLKLVEKPANVVDIYASWRAEIASRDWDGCHIRGDRRAPVDLADTRKRGWTK